MKQILAVKSGRKGEETMVGIRLKAEDGEEIHRQEADAELYARISMKAIKLFLLKEELKSNVDLFVDY